MQIVLTDSNIHCVHGACPWAQLPQRSGDEEIQRSSGLQAPKQTTESELETSPDLPLHCWRTGQPVPRGKVRRLASSML